MVDSLSFTHLGGELHLSNLGQLELLRATVEAGIPLRTRVRGFSMSPFIRDDDVLTIVPMNSCAPRSGEVVASTLPDSGRLAIHRVIVRMGTGWLVGGDNCPQADGVILRENMIGRVVRVERQGHEVRLGLGAEARLIAWLQCAHVLMPAVYLVWRVRRILKPCSSR